MKRALITGVTGQDGSYLAEHLLSLDYQVFSLVRRSSTDGHERIVHILDKIELIEGDLLDQHSLVKAMERVRPDEIYNLAAQSFVPTSFSQPVYTGEVTGLGVTRMLEAMRSVCPKARFYQASSSEMLGKVEESPQNEKTPFHPRSPYGVAKLYGHWITVNYREAYNLFAVSGILFNHECVTANTPIIIRRKENKLIDIVPIEEIVPHRENPKKGKKYTTEVKSGLEVWDGDQWSKIKTMTATWNEGKGSSDKRVVSVASRGGYYEATEDHLSFLKGGKEIKTGELKIGDHLKLKTFPKLTQKTLTSLEEAEFIGMMVADGYISPQGKGRFISNNKKLREKLEKLWEKIGSGYVQETTHPSGFGGKDVYSLELRGNPGYLRYLRKEIYTERRYKRIPVRILNAEKKIVLRFLSAYDKCDGLKASPQKTEFKCFTTNSSVLALALWYLVDNALNLRVTLHPELRGKKIYYHLNINSDGPTDKGKHLVRPLSEVKKLRRLNYAGWLFDLETESGTFSAGIGHTWIHNSPRRGPEFVTRKISLAVARIKLGKQKKLVLGNLKARRDWGFAGDYVKAMHLMLQQEKPSDFVVGTGESHSVKEFVKEAFAVVGIKDWQKYVETSKEFLRPAEVKRLVADPSRARNVLGWKPEVSFKELVKIMVEADLKRESDR